MTKVQGTDTEQLKMFVIQYANLSFLQSIFAGDSLGVSFDTEFAVTPYAVSTAFYVNNGSSIHAYAHFNNFLVELLFTGYTTSSLAIPDASTFMNYFHSKIVQ